MMSTSAVYNPGMLPTKGLHDLSLSLREYHRTLVYELQILDGIRTGPLALPIDVENELDSARYHLGMMIVIVEMQMRRSADDMGASASESPGIESAMNSYLAALLRAKACWNSWLSGRPVSFEGFGFDGTAVPSSAEIEQAVLDTSSAVTSPPISRSAVFLGLGLATAGLIFILRR